MSYDYIKKNYGIAFEPGQRVRFQPYVDRGCFGTVVEHSGGNLHYVRVRLDHKEHDVNCHPGDLTIVQPETAK